MTTAQPIRRYVSALTSNFRKVRDKREAHYQSRSVLGEMASDPRLMTAVLGQHLDRPATLNWKHYPVLGVEIEHNAYYTLVANCWIPLPGRETDVSTKTIHHHGNMLLTTVTAFGPGYEHWTFTRPEVVDPERELYTMRVIERGPHPHQHLAFVDAFIGHVPLYPAALSVTLALWSNQFPTTWRDVVKRLPLLKGREATLRQLAARVGLTRALDLKVIEYFDFYPTGTGFKGMKERIEFDLGPNDDYLYSLFHVLQATGNQALGRLVRERLAEGGPVDNRPLATALLKDLEAGRPIEGRLSPCHLSVPHATFRSAEIERALGAGGRPAVSRSA